MDLRTKMASIERRLQLVNIRADIENIGTE
jgi:hypothetical protein